MLTWSGLFEVFGIVGAFEVFDTRSFEVFGIVDAFEVLGMFEVVECEINMFVNSSIYIIQEFGF